MVLNFQSFWPARESEAKKEKKEYGRDEEKFEKFWKFAFDEEIWF